MPMQTTDVPFVALTIGSIAMKSGSMMTKNTFKD